MINRFGADMIRTGRTRYRISLRRIRPLGVVGGRGQKRVKGSTGIGWGSASSSGTRARTSSWKRRASMGRVGVVRGVDEHGRRAALAQPVGGDVDPMLPALDRPRGGVAAEVPDDRPVGQRERPERHARLLGPRISFGVAGRRALEERGGVERNPFGGRGGEHSFEKPRRARVVEERGMADLHGVPVGPGEPAQKAGERGDVGGSERSRQLDPEGMGPRAERLDRVQEDAKRLRRRR